jgi:hypothetical protein
MFYTESTFGVPKNGSKFDVILVDLRLEFHDKVLPVVPGIWWLRVGDVAIIIRSTGSP